MGVSKNRGTPKWMVYDGNPYKNGWFGGTPIFGNTKVILQYPKAPLTRWPFILPRAFIKELLRCSTKHQEAFDALRRRCKTQVLQPDTLPSGELTWQLNFPIFNRRYIFKKSMFYCHVSLLEGIWVFPKMMGNIPISHPKMRFFLFLGYGKPMGLLGKPTIFKETSI